jgi:hypothetical protein
MMIKMSNILLENDIFLTTNLKNLTDKGNKIRARAQKPNDSTESSTPIDGSKDYGQNNSNTDSEKKFRKDLNWKQELSDRLEANKNVTKDEKRSNEDILEEVWFDCFTTLWPKALYKNLDTIGENLKNDLLNWGFTAETNQVVAFLNQKFVQENLVLTKKLNINTYKAFHNAITKKLISKEQFDKSNNYNIIYCIALYDKSPKDIYDYLVTQSKILNASASSYDAATQLKNRRIFCKLNISATDLAKRAEAHVSINPDNIPTVQKAALNSLELAQAIITAFKNNKNSKFSNSNKEINELDLEDKSANDETESGEATETTNSASDETVGTNEPKNAKLNKARQDNDRIIKAFKELGLPTDDLTVTAKDKNGKEYRKASDKLNKLRKTLFNDEASMQ